MREKVSDNHIVIYIGTHKIAAALGSLEKSDPAILRHAEIVNPDGFRQGLVTSIEQASFSIEQLVDKLLPSVEISDLRVRVVLGNAKLQTYRFSSSQYFQGYRRTISSYDIRSVVEQTRSVSTLPLSEFILQAIPESFLVNDMPGIRNPLGMEAHRLGVNLNVFTMGFEDFRNISKAFESAEVEVESYFPKTLVISEAILTDQEKEEGALIVDIGDQVTQMVLWKNGWLKGTRGVEFGGGMLSQNIAEAWNIDPADAEKVKEKYGSLEKQMTCGEELIPLVDRNGKGAYSVRSGEFHGKFQKFAKEFWTSVMKQADAYAREEKVLHPHIILTGGGSSCPGLIEFVGEEFSRPVRIGTSRRVEAPNELLVSPTYSGLLGMFRWLSTQERAHKQLVEPQGVFQKTLVSARQWFAHYF